MNSSCLFNACATKWFIGKNYKLETNPKQYNIGGGGGGVFFPKAMADMVEASDDSRSLKRKKSTSCSLKNEEEGAGIGNMMVATLTVDLTSLSRDQKRELRKRLKLNLDEVKSIAAKIDVRQEYLLSASKSQVCTTDVDAHLSRTDGNNGSSAGKEVTSGKEKRTPKANQLYLNSEFVSGKDRMPPPEKLKPKGSSSTTPTTPGAKKGGNRGKAAEGRGGDGRRQKVEAARAKRMAEILKQCSTMLKKIMSHKYAWVFNEPVDAAKQGLHDYHKVIQKPMDLGTVRDRLAKGLYSSLNSFADDVRLTFANAMTYNPQGHDVYVMAQVLAGLFNDRWKDIVKKLEEEKLKIKVEEETLAAAPLHYDTTTTSGQTHSSLHDLHEHLKRVESQIQSLAKKSSSSKPAPPAVRPASSSAAQAKPRPSDIEKRPMTFEEKRKLSINLETLPGDKLERIVQIIKKRNPDVGQNEDEIEVDIDSFDNDTLWELDRFITNCMKSRGKKKATKKASKKAQHGFSEAPQFVDVFFVSLCACYVKASHRYFVAGAEGGEEEVDIDDDLAPSQFAPVVIDKDRGAETAGSKSSSSDGDSSDSGSSSSDSDSGSSSGSESDAEDAQSVGAGSKTAHEKEPMGSAAVGDSKGRLALQLNNTQSEEVVAEGTPPERQVSPNKLLRAALLRGRFADTILKAQEKTLLVDKNEKVDPEQLRKDREKLERRQKEEKARLQAEAIAAKKEAALEARRMRELEREAARRALQQMEKTVEIDESSEILKDLERLRSVSVEQLVGSSGEEDSPKNGSSDGLPQYPLQGGNPLERLGLFMKDDEDEDEHQGDIEDGHAEDHKDRHDELVQIELDKPTAPDIDVEEGEIDEDLGKI
ncbi:unnamed protein product [Sphagnum troendelagicum]|uniref:Uncharacterized protein n=1 Tax=Sphagnum jensenii TaxID=128206 RepID=A0ABP0VKN0_9BRYO